VYLPATGTTLWTGAFKKLRLTRGTYALRIRAIDVSSNVEHKARRRGPLRNFRTIRLR
jgi:hypothetical protein